MSYLDAILLGVLQGITEFLPISSDGHLVVVQQLLGFEHSLLAFDVFIHLGTLLAVVIYYRREIASIAAGFFRREGGDAARRLVGLIVLASIPTALIGLGLKALVEDLNTSALAAALGWLVTGLVLLSTERAKHTPRSMTDIRALDALLIGIAQGIAVLPGVSRSGSTVAVGMFRGIRAGEAANFSFLMSIPAVAGAALLEAGDLNGVASDEWPVYIVGGITAGIVGYLAIWGLLKLLARRVIKPFGWYCIAAAAVTLMTIGVRAG
ncbi:undecaprenyl-diphosphate phosphatase [candidate division KSB1 bacterium]|nr:undecaprenyl-diphosphate phosphatase [candidate division KSB1 bacterium]